MDPARLKDPPKIISMPPTSIDESASVAQVPTGGPKRRYSNNEDRQEARKKRQKAYEQRKRKSNEAVAQKSQNLRK
jgi:hypothetical protein